MVDYEYWRRRYDEPPVTIPDTCQYEMTLLSPGLWSGLEVCDVPVNYTLDLPYLVSNGTPLSYRSI